MYTIKEAAARTGVTVPLLRAWETRYGVVRPGRTEAGYRLYDEAAIHRLRSMRALVDAGWTPSAAAAAILAGTAPAMAPNEPNPAREAVESATARDGATGRIKAFVDAAATMDPVRLEGVLDEMFARGSFEQATTEEVLPGLAAVGDAWADGRLGVGAEHVASHAVLRRLAGAFQAAGRPSAADGSILVGLPPGSRHELGALAFAVAARRAGLAVLYLGPDLPAADWVATAVDTGARVAVIGTPTRSDVDAASHVARTLEAAIPGVTIAFGGRSASRAASRLAATDTGDGPPAVVLPDGLIEAVDTVASIAGGLPG